MTALLGTASRAPITPPEIRPPLLKRPLRSLRRLGPDGWLALAVTAAVLAVQAWNITGFPTVSDDEGTYLAQAWAVQHHHGLAPYTYWYDHPPLGWMQLAVLSWLPGLLASPAHVFTAELRVAMLPVTAASALLLHLLARRSACPAGPPRSPCCCSD